MSQSDGGQITISTREYIDAAMQQQRDHIDKRFDDLEARMDSIVASEATIQADQKTITLAVSTQRERVGNLETRMKGHEDMHNVERGVIGTAIVAAQFLGELITRRLTGGS